MLQIATLHQALSEDEPTAIRSKLEASMTVDVETAYLAQHDIESTDEGADHIACSLFFLVILIVPINSSPDAT